MIHLMAVGGLLVTLLAGAGVAAYKLSHAARVELDAVTDVANRNAAVVASQAAAADALAKANAGLTERHIARQRALQARLRTFREAYDDQVSQDEDGAGPGLCPAQCLLRWPSGDG